MKQCCKKVLSLLLATVLFGGIVSNVFVNDACFVYAQSQFKCIEINQNILTPQMDGDLVKSTQKVYYGTDGTNALKWDVIGLGNCGAVSLEGITLLSSKVLGMTVFGNDDGNYWYAKSANGSPANDSLLKTKIDGYADGYFTTVEKSGINKLKFDTTNNISSKLSDNFFGNVKVDASLWPLSYKESKKLDSSIRCAENAWWTRSLARDSGMCYVKNDGTVVSGTGLHYADTSGVRPALNIDSAKVLFVSSADANGKKSKAAGASGLEAVGYSSGNEWKLTIQDLDRNFGASRIGSGDVLPGDTVSISYTGAKKGEGEYISAMIQDVSTGEITWYGHIVDMSTGNEDGNADIVVPSDLSGEQKIYVFSEKCNGLKETDYSSAMSSFEINIGKKEPSKDDFTITLPTDLQYDGSSKEPVIVPKNGMGTLTVNYFDSNDVKLELAPTAVGNYYFTIDVAEGTSYTAKNDISDPSWNYEIVNHIPDASDFSVTLPTDLGYDGNEKPVTFEVLNTVINPSDVTLNYYDSNNQLMTGAPKEKGTYTVKFDVNAGTYYNAATGITKSDWTYTISDIAVTGLVLSQNNVALYPNESCTLVASIQPPTASNPPTIKWKSSDTSVAQVDANGKVTAKGIGSTKITAITDDDQFSAVCNVAVLPVPNENVEAHTCNFEHKILQEASDYSDGLEADVCTICGKVENVSTLSGLGFTLNNVENILKNLKASGKKECVIELNMLNSLPKRVMELIAQNSQCKIILHFTYEHKKYEVVIPAGAKFTLDPKDEWYGPLKLKQMFGWKEIQ